MSWQLFLFSCCLYSKQADSSLNPTQVDANNYSAFVCTLESLLHNTVFILPKEEINDTQWRNRTAVYTST